MPSKSKPFHPLRSTTDSARLEPVYITFHSSIGGHVLMDIIKTLSNHGIDVNADPGSNHFDLVETEASVNNRERAEA